MHIITPQNEKNGGRTKLCKWSILYVYTHTYTIDKLSFTRQGNLKDFVGKKIDLDCAPFTYIEQILKENYYLVHIKKKLLFGTYRKKTISFFNPERKLFNN